MRQVGILCAGALVALRDNVGQLEADHKKAKILAGNVCSHVKVEDQVADDTING